MSEMPKRIWWCASEMLASKHQDGLDEIAYIRADLVDELVTALKTAHCWTSREIHTQHTAPLIEGVLSKLEDDLEDRNDD